MTRRTTVMDISIQAILAAFLLNTVQAGLQDNGPQTFQAQDVQYAQGYKEVIMYLTPTQIRNYEAGHGLPYFSSVAPSYNYEQQKPEQGVPINEEEGQIIQSTLDVLEANKMHFQQTQENNADSETSKAPETQEDRNADIRPIEEPSAEQPPAQYQFSAQQQDKNKLIEQEQSNKDQEQIAKSYAYIHFFTNKKPESQEKVQIFHPEPHTVNLDKEIRLQKEKNVEIQQDPLLRQKFRLIPYQYVPGENQDIHQQIREQLIKQQNQDQVQFFVPENSQMQAIKERENQQKNTNVQHQYAPQFSNINTNIDLAKILKDIQLEREAARIHADAINRSPAVVIQKDVSIIRRRPIEVTKHVHVPYPTPYFVPIFSPVEIKVPQPYPVPLEIVRHVPVPIVKTERVEVAKPVPYEVEKHVHEVVEKKVYVPVDKPYTVDRVVPVEVKKQIPVEIPVHRPEKFTIIRHIWKH